MRTWNFLGCLLAIGAIACGGGGGSDAGTDAPAPPDSGPADAGPPPTLMAYDRTMMMAVPADLSCVGTATAPTAGASMSFPTRVVSRGATYMPQMNAMYQLFTDNMPATTCGSNCMSGMSGTDGMGTSVMLPANGWISYRVIGDDTAGTITTLQINKAVELSNYMGGTATPDALELSVVPSGIFTGALGAAAVTRQAGTAIFTGTGVDCMGRNLINATVRVFNGTTEVTGGPQTAPMGVRYVYWPDGMAILPSSSRTATSNQGRYAGANLPAGSPLRIELWGIRTAGGQPSMVGCEEIPANADELALVDIGPARSDGPTGCSM